jgi:hypothetical protein
VNPAKKGVGFMEKSQVEGIERREAATWVIAYLAKVHGKIPSRGN